MLMVQDGALFPGTISLRRYTQQNGSSVIGLVWKSKEHIFNHRTHAYFKQLLEGDINLFREALPNR